MDVLRKFTLTILLVPLLSHAARFEPVDFKGGETWTYEVTTTSGGMPVSQFQQQYSVLWKTRSGRFLTGQRKGQSNNAWAPGEDFASSRCLVFVPDLTFDFGSDFCAGEVQVGQQSESETKLGKSTVKYEGSASVSSSLGFFKSDRFTVVDELKGAGDSTAPTATQRLWEFWYVPDLRGFFRMNLQYRDASGVIVRTVTMKLVATSLRPGAD